MEKLAIERQHVLLDRMEDLKRELLMAVDLAIAQRKIEELEGRLKQSEARPTPGELRRSTRAESGA